MSFADIKKTKLFKVGLAFGISALVAVFLSILRSWIYIQAVQSSTAKAGLGIIYTVLTIGENALFTDVFISMLVLINVVIGFLILFYLLRFLLSVIFRFLKFPLQTKMRPVSSTFLFACCIDVCFICLMVFTEQFFWTSFSSVVDEMDERFKPLVHSLNDYYKNNNRYPNERVPFLHAQKDNLNLRPALNFNEMKLPITVSDDWINSRWREKSWAYRSIYEGKEYCLEVPLPKIGPAYGSIFCKYILVKCSGNAPMSFGSVSNVEKEFGEWQLIRACVS